MHKSHHGRTIPTTKAFVFALFRSRGYSIKYCQWTYYFYAFHQVNYALLIHNIALYYCLHPRSTLSSLNSEWRPERLCRGRDGPPVAQGDGGGPDRAPARGEAQLQLLHPTVQAALPSVPPASQPSPCLAAASPALKDFVQSPLLLPWIRPPYYGPSATSPLPRERQARMTGVLVSAATGAMGSLLGKLATMLTDKYKLFKGVRGDIEFLKKELEAMHVFLLRMADVEEPDEQAKLRVNAVRNLSYDIEDNIDDFMLLVDRESDPDARGLEELFRRCKKKIKDINIRHKIAKEVKDIMSQVNEVSERYKRYQIGESSSKFKNEKVDPRVVAVFKNASELVGIDGPRDEIVKWLSMDSGESAHKQKVVSVVGYGGLGKTTLANQAYHNIGSSFDCRAFVSVSRDPDMTKILSSILSQISNGDIHVEVGDQQLIIGQIREYLKDKRYFIVVDDIWDIPTWRILDCALFKNSCGSRVMTTTRKVDVAECCSLDEGLVYKIKPLSDADSKKLFFKRIFGCEESCPDDFKEASKIIIKKCGGLPLAINAISSLLAGRQTKEEWIRVGRSIGSAQGKNADIEAMNYILSLSYIDLPHYLRSCLLYLTLFPEDYEIERERLVHRWISEGFIHGEDGQDLVELGDAYFHELVNRSLIQPVDIDYDGKARCCRVHDTILDFLISKSADENFCALLRGHSKITQDVIDGRVRRLSLVGGSEDGGCVNISAKWNSPRVRSVGIFEDVKELPSFLNLSALRVMDAVECRGLTDGHVKDIARLYQLRYLNIHNALDVSKLPSEIGDLQYLETLVLPYFSTKFVEIPTTITRLQRLVRLYIPFGAKFSDGIGKMKKLQVLGYINIGVQSLNFLQELGELASLKNLLIHLNVGSMEEDNTLVSCIEKLAPSLLKLEACSLRDLRVALYLGENDGVLEDVSFPALSSIRVISVHGQRICRFTKWLVSLANLEKLWVHVKDIEQQDLEMVGRLPTLLEFTLVVHGNREEEPITVTGGGFLELRSFQFHWVPTFELLVQPKMKGLLFEAGAMPKLKALRLHNYDLKSAAGRYELGIHHLSSLASLRVSLDCTGVRAADVEAAEVAFRSMADTHPNHPITLETSRERLHAMLPADDQ